MGEEGDGGLLVGEMRKIRIIRNVTKEEEKKEEEANDEENDDEDDIRGRAGRGRRQRQ